MMHTPRGIGSRRGRLELCPSPVDQAPEAPIVQHVHLTAFLLGLVRACIGLGAQAQGVLPPHADNPGMPKVEQHGEQIVQLVVVAATSVTVKDDFGKGQHVPYIPELAPGNWTGG
jgi:hypothetical protein